MSVYIVTHIEPKSVDEIRELSRQYDELYAEGQALFDKHKPCEVKCGKCLAFRKKFYPTNFCCDGCTHLGENGCTVQALWCKLWSCEPIQEKGLKSGFTKELSKLLSKARRLGLTSPRASKEETFARNFNFDIKTL